jgi:hypothetical protein
MTIMAKNLGNIYDLGHRGNLRGKAKEGFIRPTIKQFFTSDNWSQLTRAYSIGWDQESPNFSENHIFSSDGMTATVNHTGWRTIWITRETSATDGKVFFEVEVGGPAQIGFTTQYYTEILTQSAYGAYHFSAYHTATIGMAVDTGTGVIGVYYNGVFQGNNPHSSYSIPGNMLLPTSGGRFAVSTHENGDQITTLNLGQKPWAYEPPAGYTGYLS